MSSEHNSNQFLTQEYVMAQKGLPENIFTDKVLRIIKSANRAVVLSLTPIKDDIILDGTKFFPDAQDTAMLYFDSEYERLILKQLEESKTSLTNYKDSRDQLIKAVKAQPKESARAIKAGASVSVSSNLLNNIQGVTDERGNFFDN